MKPETRIVAPVLEVICKLHTKSTFKEVADEVSEYGNLNKYDIVRCRGGLKFIVPGNEVSAVGALDCVLDNINLVCIPHNLHSQDAGLQKVADAYITNQIYIARSNADSHRQVYLARRPLLKRYDSLVGMVIAAHAMGDDRAVVFIPDIVADANAIYKQIRNIRPTTNACFDLSGVPELVSEMGREARYNARNISTVCNARKLNDKIKCIEVELMLSAIENMSDNRIMTPRSPDWFRMAVVAAVADEITVTKDDSHITHITKLTDNLCQFMDNLLGVIKNYAISVVTSSGTPQAREHRYYGIKALISAYDNLTDIYSNYRCAGLRSRTKIMRTLNDTFDKYKRPITQMRHIFKRLDKY